LCKAFLSGDVLVQVRRSELVLVVETIFNAATPLPAPKHNDNQPRLPGSNPCEIAARSPGDMILVIMMAPLVKAQLVAALAAAWWGSSLSSNTPCSMFVRYTTVVP
jgi:hypothetical protein